MQAKQRQRDTDTDRSDDLVTDGGLTIEGVDDDAQVHDDDRGDRLRPWAVPAISGVMVGGGTVATWIAARPVLAAARRHLADPDASAFRSIPTYLRELYIETDFVGPVATGDAWMGTMLVVVGVALLAAWGWGR